MKEKLLFNIDTEEKPYVQKSTEAAKLRLALVGPVVAGKHTLLSWLPKALKDVLRSLIPKEVPRTLLSPLELRCRPARSPFSPEKYIHAIKAAEQADYDIVILDSLSHAGQEKAACSTCMTVLRSLFAILSRPGAVTPQHNALVDAILGSTCHVIVDHADQNRLRDHERKREDQSGQGRLAPVQRDGVEYEFTVVTGPHRRPCRDSQ